MRIEGRTWNSSVVVTQRSEEEHCMSTSASIRPYQGARWVEAFGVSARGGGAEAHGRHLGFSQGSLLPGVLRHARGQLSVPSARTRPHVPTVRAPRAYRCHFTTTVAAAVVVGRVTAVV
jgi:hypothetical protein